MNEMVRTQSSGFYFLEQVSIEQESLISNFLFFFFVVVFFSLENFPLLSRFKRKYMLKDKQKCLIACGEIL